MGLPLFAVRGDNGLAPRGTSAEGLAPRCNPPVGLARGDNGLGLAPRGDIDTPTPLGIGGSGDLLDGAGLLDRVNEAS